MKEKIRDNQFENANQENNENRFVFEGVTYVAEENWNDTSSGCDGCAFEYNYEKTCAWRPGNGIPWCKSTDRKDGRSVIFVRG